MPNWTGLATRGALLALACFGLWLIYHIGYGAGQLDERLAWTSKRAKDTEVALTNKATADIHAAVATQESSDDLKGQLVDALAAANARPSRLCGSAATPHDLPGAAPAPAGADEPGQAAELATEKADDAACAEGVTKAQGWQDWWQKVSAIPR